MGYNIWEYIGIDGNILNYIWEYLGYDMGYDSYDIWEYMG
jgi:hypothetical protein